MPLPPMPLGGLVPVGVIVVVVVVVEGPPTLTHVVLCSSLPVTLMPIPEEGGEVPSMLVGGEPA